MAKRKKCSIPIKDAAGKEGMRAAGRTASEILQEVIGFVQAGRSTLEVDEFAAGLMRARGCVSAFKGYRGFPAYTCISKNEEVVHGIGAADNIIKEGDVLSVDVGIELNGWIGDNATTIPVGEIAEETKRLLAATEESLYQAISFARDGVRLADLCASVDEYVRPKGFKVVREFVGHGVGSSLHEEPSVPNYRPVGRTPRLRPGMVLAIEPMVNAGTAKVKILADKWTVITQDRKPSAHYEHTVLVTEDEPEILTDRPRIATPELLGLGMAL